MDTSSGDSRKDRLLALLEQVRGVAFSSEADVQARLIEPVLEILGWRLNSSNREVWISLTGEMARTWNYSSGRMRRDYVLAPHPAGPLNIEAKHRWARNSMDMDRFLARVNAGDWEDTRQDGPKKDLALLLWGTRAGDGRLAVLMDEKRMLVFDWDGGWRVAAEERIFEEPPDRVLNTLLLLTTAEVIEHPHRLDTTQAAAPGGC